MAVVNLCALGVVDEKTKTMFVFNRFVQLLLAEYDRLQQYTGNIFHIIYNATELLCIYFTGLCPYNHVCTLLIKSMFELKRIGFKS